MTAIIYTIDLAGCNQTWEYKDLGDWISVTSQQLDAALNSPLLTHCHFIVVLSNIITVRRQVASSKLHGWLPDSFVGTGDVDSIIEYIIQQFKQVNRGKLPLNFHLVEDATDVASFRRILASIRQILLGAAYFPRFCNRKATSSRKNKSQSKGQQ